MPKIAIYKFLTFFIYSFDAINEPPHLHVVKEKGSHQKSAKIWITPLKIATKGNLSNNDLTLVLKLIHKNQVILLNAVNDVKQGKKIKTIKLK